MQFNLSVSDRRVVVKFDQFPQQLHGVLLSRITSLTETLRAMVDASAPEATGKLRRNIVSRVEDRPQRIHGSVFVHADYGKAAALEYGAHNTIQVKSHSQRLDHVFALQVSPLSVMVAAYARHLDIAERRYLRGPLAALKPEIL